MPEEDDRRPRNHIYDAQEFAALWRYECMRIHRLGDEADVQRNVAWSEYHTAIVEYAGRLAPRIKKSNNDDVENLWENKKYTILETNGESKQIEGLCSLRKYGFQETSVKDHSRTVNSGGQVQTQRQSIEIHPRSLVKLHEDLDDIAVELGFGASPKQQLPTDKI